ncbi:MAG: GntR family transcriptional regulator [Alphaproteobacteria bacterium]|nr:GntR family transcriptional regulator [Alphaproteobacteria bacterium]
MARVGKPRGSSRRDHFGDAVYAQIKADIFDFRLLPGARFSENEVARRARVSRTPVREALMRLEREGYLQVHAKSGWSVCPLDFAQFDHLYDLRVVLELAAVQKLCAGKDIAALDRLRAIWLVSPSLRVVDGAKLARMDEEFHSTLVAAAGNPEVARIHHGITERIRILRRLDFTHPERIIYTYREHAEILRALLARDADRASALLRAHIEASRAVVQTITLHRLHLAHLDAKPSARTNGAARKPAAARAPRRR